MKRVEGIADSEAAEAEYEEKNVWQGEEKMIEYRLKRVIVTQPSRRCTRCE